jgi:putative aldouronate transport system substrate-binding protein
MRRYLILILAVVMLFTLAVAGCRKPETPAVDTQGTKPSGTSVSSESSADTGYKLPLSTSGDSLRIFTRENLYTGASYGGDPLPVFEEFEKRTGVKIIFELAPLTQYAEVLKTRLASGVNLPDIIFSDGNFNYVKMYSDGVIVPMEEFINGHAPNLKWLLDELPEVRKSVTSPDGHILYIPKFEEAISTMDEVINRKVEGPGTTVDTMMVLIRKDWLDKLGLKVPSTLDEWYDVLKAFKERDPNGNNKADEIPIAGRNGRFFPFGAAFGIHVIWPSSGFSINEDNKVEFNYIEPEMKELLAWTNRAYKDGLIDKEIFTDDMDKLHAKVINDTVGVVSNEWMQHIPKLESSLRNSGVSDADIIPVLPPTGKNGKAFIVRNARNNPEGVCITPDCKKPDLAIKWLDYYYAHPEGLLLNNYGIEGMSYTMNNGKPRYTEFITKNPDGLSPSDALQSIGGRSTIPFIWPSDAQMDLFAGGENIDFMKSNMKYASIEPAFGLPTLEEADRYNKLMSEILTYRDEMLVKFIMGTEPISNFDNYVATMKTLGIDEVIQIKQAQYDRFLNN